jgi:hypothetical protein
MMSRNSELAPNSTDDEDDDEDEDEDDHDEGNGGFFGLLFCS